MHAAGTVLQKCFAEVFTQMHAARVAVLCNAVLTLLSCRRLVLMELARAWPGALKVRAPLKRLDRLLSNRHLAQERVALYRHMAHWLIGRRDALIIVDWSTLKADESWHLLRAALAVGGRTLTLYEEVHSKYKQQSPRVHRLFLRRLKELLPPAARVIIVSDAGFRCPWFKEVERLGWQFVGRVRNRVYVELKQDSVWQLTKTLLSSTAALTGFGQVRLVRRQPYACGLLRYRQARKGRKHRSVRGSVCKTRASREAARSQTEPWLIAYSTSLKDEPLMQIVQWYKKRMQIEQSFRDLKSARYGCAFEHSLTRLAPRLEALFLLHALATFLAWIEGMMLKRARHTQHCEVRVRQHSSYSILRIGWEALRRGLDYSLTRWRNTLHSTGMPSWMQSSLAHS